MRPLVSSAAALEADRRAETEAGYPPHLLMEEAGIRLQDRLESLRAQGRLPAGPVLYLAGLGNNGGDALAMARHAWLRGEVAVAVWMPWAPKSESTRLQLAWAQAAGVPFVEAWNDPTLVVDGLWGTGLTARLRPEAARWVEDLSERLGATPVVALDVPSGLWEGWVPGDPVLAAHTTLVPGWAKEFSYHPEARSLGGTIEVVPLSFPFAARPTTTLVEADDLETLVPPVTAHAHKGRRGHVALVGGSPGMTGALVLAARSAAAAGAGLVSLGTDPEVVGLVAPQVPAFQTRTLGEVPGLASRYDALVVGPGWGRTDDRPVALSRLVALGLPMCIDADGLVAWQAAAFPMGKAPLVITPHPGEFARLAPGEGLLVPRGRALAQATGAVVVLKGAVTWVLGPDGRQSVWDGANPALGTGGSGDCLAGVVGALLAVGLDGFDAARAAVALHGCAGRALADAEGWFTADRLPEALARVSAACRAPKPGL